MNIPIISELLLRRRMSDPEDPGTVDFVGLYKVHLSMVLSSEHMWRILYL